MDFLFCAIQAATPAKSPPPPTGTKTTSKSFLSSRISLPIVPCPAIVSGSSKGWINDSFFFFAKLVACLTAAS